MKRALIGAALLLAAPALLAQDKQPAKEAAKPAAAVTVEKAPADKAPIARKSRRAEDARHCLDKASNNEIIKCAEAYL
jgi:hypothetical protein